MSGIARKDWYENLTHEQQKMSIGTVVTSKKTGLPMIGIIGALYDPIIYYTLCKRSKEDYQTWNELYPNWEDKILAIVIFHEPQKPISFSEFSKAYHDKSPEWIKVHYDDIPPQTSAIYPIDDLELYNEEFDSDF